MVCRIFQKAGPGPQNGAQYGAPFVEEEWEEDDEDVGLLPVEGDAVVHHELPPAPKEIPGALEKGYLQMSDLIQVYSCKQSTCCACIFPCVFLHSRNSIQGAYLVPSCTF